MRGSIFDYLAGMHSVLYHPQAFSAFMAREGSSPGDNNRRWHLIIVIEHEPIFAHLRRICLMMEPMLKMRTRYVIVA